jgi:hypothetical protein
MATDGLIEALHVAGPRNVWRAGSGQPHTRRSSVGSAPRLR